MQCFSTNPLLALALVFLGGGLGSVGRYLVAGLDHHLNRHAFPFGTLLVNLLGCFAIGVVAAWLVSDKLADHAREPWRLVLAIGVLGGFTTFSTFGLETVRLLGEGRVGLAAGYVLASNLGNVALAWAGLALATRVFAPAT